MSIDKWGSGGVIHSCIFAFSASTILVQLVSIMSHLSRSPTICSVDILPTKGEISESRKETAGAKLRVSSS